MLLRFKDTKKILLIRNVYYIPELGINILSISSIPKLQVKININNKSIFLYSKREFLIEGNEKGGLYCLYNIALRKKEKEKNELNIKKIFNII